MDAKPESYKGSDRWDERERLSVGPQATGSQSPDANAGDAASMFPT